MVGQSDLRATRELVRAPAIPGRAPRVDEGDAPESSLMATVLQLQRAAGNRAVTSALTAAQRAASPGDPVALQREPADSAGSASAGAMLGAVWDSQVVVPLARAAERLGRDKPDLKGARPELVTALGTIATLRNATPTGDPNHMRLQIVERRARGPLDLIDRRQGGGAKGHPLENGMIEVRAEATSLGPQLEHMPDQEALLQKGAVGGTTPASPATTTPSGGSSAAEGGPSVADAWKILVIDRFWAGQRALEENPDMGYFHWSVAIGRIQEFFNAAPSGHPNRLPLLKLFTDAMQVHDLMGELAPDFGGDPLADRAEEAYSTAVDMTDLLTGQPSPTAPPAESTAPAESAEPGEPDFTWERERPPMTNDTELEQP